MFNMLNEKEAEYFKTRWKEYVLDDFPGIDERIKLSTVKLSTIPGVVPIWSCSGHTLKEHENLKRNFRVPQIRYIIFGIYEEPECFDDYKFLFERFEDWYRNLNLKTFRSFRPSLETKYLTNKSVEGEYTLSPVWKLAFNYKLQYKEELNGDDPVNLEAEWGKLISHLCGE